MRPIGCPETLVSDYHSTLHNIPGERRSQNVSTTQPWRHPLPFKTPENAFQLYSISWEAVLYVFKQRFIYFQPQVINNNRNWGLTNQAPGCPCD